VAISDKIIVSDGFHWHETPGEWALLNQAFLYGESFFTTMLSDCGKVSFLAEHINRLERSFHFFDPGEDFPHWAGRVYEGLRLLHSDKVGRKIVRSTFFRDLQGKWMLHLWARDFDEEGVRPLKLKTVRREVPSAFPSHIKHGHYALAHHHRRQVRSEGFDELLFVDQHDNILESPYANAFALLADGTVATASLKNHVLEGIARAHLINALRSEGYLVREGGFFAESCEGLVLTNAVRGVVDVTHIGKRELDRGHWWALLCSKLLHAKMKTHASYP
jgi:branched-subunit amino acid aminotransferase/4-amino-4-deoxychorismate lyase